MVISVSSPDGPRLEFPPGHVIYQQKAGWFGYPRFSPDGSRIAFENHAISANDDGEVDLIDLNGNLSVLFRSNSVEGLAWSPDGNELWFASTAKGGWADTLYAVKPGSQPRVVLTAPSIRLFDISKDGRVLLSHESWRRQTRGLFPGDKEEHLYSWLDSTEPTSISADGRFFSFYEAGEIYALESDVQSYYRPTDGSAAIRLGPGTSAISPDGKWVIIGSNHSQPRRPLQLQPLGPGQPRDLPTPGLVAFDQPSWSDGGQRIVYEAQNEQGEWNVFTQLISNGQPVRIVAGRFSYAVLSPDGKTVALQESGGGISLYPANGGKSVAAKGAKDSELPVRFTNGGKSLLVVNFSGQELVLTRVDLANGRREPWKTVTSAALTGSPLVTTPDLKYYAYKLEHYTSVLYTVDHLR